MKYKCTSFAIYIKLDGRLKMIMKFEQLYFSSIFITNISQVLLFAFLISLKRNINIF